MVEVWLKYGRTIGVYTVQERIRQIISYYNPYSSKYVKQKD